MINNRRILISIFLISFTIRLIAAVVYLNFDKHSLTLNRKPFFCGSYSTTERIGRRDLYNTNARHIVLYGKMFHMKIHPPLYPIFLSIFYILFGYNIYSFLIPQITLAAANTILIFFLAQHLFDNKKISLMAGLFYAFNPHFILISIQLYSETLYLFLLLSVFLLFKKLLSKTTVNPVRDIKNAACGSKISNEVKNSIFAGIFMGLTALCRSVFLIFIPFIFIWLIIVFYQEKRKMLILLFTIFLSFSAVYGIWIIRNYKVFHRISFSVDTSAAWKANRPSNINEVVKFRNKYKNEGTAFINWVKRNPRQYFNLCIKRLKSLLFEPCVKGVTFRHKAASSFIFFFIYPLGYLGIAKAVRERKKIAFLALLFITSTVIFHSLTIIDGELRYRLPVELFITIFAAYGLCVILDLFRGKEITLRTQQT